MGDADEWHLPPFPPLRRPDEEWPFPVEAWVGSVELPSWGEFRYRGCGAEAHLYLSWPEEDEGPAPSQVAAFRYLLAHEKAITDAVLQAILDLYAQVREALHGTEHALQALERADELRPLIGLEGVHIPPRARDGVGHVGFAFWCRWDEDHGLGVLTHRDRVVEVGGGDVAWGYEIADEGADDEGE